jgi:hypothetical protein
VKTREERNHWSNITVHTKKRKEERKKKEAQTKRTDLGGRGERCVYVLQDISVTAPTFQAEMFAFKELLP